jgi:hypothetical protein
MLESSEIRRVHARMKQVLIAGRTVIPAGTVTCLGIGPASVEEIDALTGAMSLYSLVRSPELQGVLLQAWLGRTPDQPLGARLELVRAFTRLYYAGVLLSASAAAS